MVRNVAKSLGRTILEVEKLYVPWSSSIAPLDPFAELIVMFSAVGFEGNLSLLDICSHLGD